VSRRAVVLGKGSLAIRIADWFRRSPEWELAWVVPVVPEPAWAPSLVDWCREQGQPFVESGRYEEIPAAEEIDLAFSVTYSHILPAEFIERCGRILNLHNAPLPRYRGVSPINWALKHRESTHGVTIHEITPGVDDGPIVSQVFFSIYPEHDEVRGVYERALAFGWTLFEQTMPMLDRIEPVEQDEEMATYFTRAQNDLLGERRSWTRAESA
jgi:methionyl-tRNA formyltransferase